MTIGYRLLMALNKLLRYYYYYYYYYYHMGVATCSEYQSSRNLENEPITVQLVFRQACQNAVTIINS